MDKYETYKEDLNRIKGKTIAIVYIFEGEDAPGFQHYHIWQSDVISKWMNAVQELYCLPLILDVRTFVEKAIGRTLPHIDFVLNLNCGSCQLSSMALVPAMCSFLAVPCIPCDAVSIVTGENKRLSNLIADGIGMNVPKELIHSSPNGIYRPLNFGSSFGVIRGHYERGTNDNGLYQEFIPGYDITTPGLYNPLSGQIELLPTVVYLPEVNDPDWFFGENEKEVKRGYTQDIHRLISPELGRQFLDMAKALSINTFFRIDARVSIQDVTSQEELLHTTLTPNNTYFVEINPMPTVKQDNGYGFSYGALSEGDSFFVCMEEHTRLNRSADVHSFILANSMIAYLRAKY